jgi:hypothetical protein
MKTNYVRIVDIPEEEEREMYLKMSKKELVGMLMECQKLLKILKDKI